MQRGNLSININISQGRTTKFGVKERSVAVAQQSDILANQSR